MNRYILVYRSNSGNWKFKEGAAVGEVEFLEKVDDKILKKAGWDLYEITSSSSKEDYIHSGMIDAIIDDEHPKQDCPGCGEEVPFTHELIAGEMRPVPDFPCDNCGWHPEDQLGKLEAPEGGYRRGSDMDRL